MFFLTAAQKMGAGLSTSGLASWGLGIKIVFVGFQKNNFLGKLFFFLTWFIIFFLLFNFNEIIFFCDDNVMEGSNNNLNNMPVIENEDSTPKPAKGVASFLFMLGIFCGVALSTLYF